MNDPQLTSFYKITLGSIRVPEEVKAHRFTESSVWLKYGKFGPTDRRTARLSEYQCYYPSLKEALEAQIKNLEAGVVAAESKIKSLKKNIDSDSARIAEIKASIEKGEASYIAYSEPPNDADILV